jgi:hypothetical protein
LQALVAESEAAKDASAFAQKVLDLRDKYTRIIAHAFASDRKFLNALNSSFEARACSFVFCVASPGSNSMGFVGLYPASRHHIACGMAARVVPAIFQRTGTGR